MQRLNYKSAIYILLVKSKDRRKWNTKKNERGKCYSAGEAKDSVYQNDYKVKHIQYEIWNDRSLES